MELNYFEQYISSFIYRLNFRSRGIPDSDLHILIMYTQEGSKLQILEIEKMME